jgi:hypothetical protein
MVRQPPYPNDPDASFSPGDADAVFDRNGNHCTQLMPKLIDTGLDISRALTST